MAVMQFVAVTYPKLKFHPILMYREKKNFDFLDKSAKSIPTVDNSSKEFSSLLSKYLILRVTVDNVVTVCSSGFGPS